MLRHIQITSILVAMLAFVLSVVAYDSNRQLDGNNTSLILNEKEVEIQVLATFAKNDRQARKWHRAIERYRGAMAHLEAQQKEGVADERISIPFRDIAGVTKLLRSQTPSNKRFIRELIRRNIDLEAYLASGAMPDSLRTTWKRL